MAIKVLIPAHPNGADARIQPVNDPAADDLRLDALQYAELRRMVKQQGLLDRQPLYYSIKIPFTVGLVAASIAFLVSVDSVWLQLLNAAFLGVVFTQLAFIGHDAGHQEIFSSVKRNDLISLMTCILIAAWVPSWWHDKHNQRHHRNPNRIGEDGDIDASPFAFSIGRAFAKTGLPEPMCHALMFFSILFLSSLSFLYAGIHYVLAGRPLKYSLAEPLSVVAHLIAYFALLFFFLDPLHAVLFIVVHQAVEGLYMGLVFAPNHKGMPVLDGETPMGFLRQQVTTARDVRAHPVTDFFYGCLNYQIEHHLFPSMPRNNLKKAKSLVKEFCHARSIPYYETGVIQAHREILGHMRSLSPPLRKKRA